MCLEQLEGKYEQRVPVSYGGVDARDTPAEFFQLEVVEFALLEHMFEELVDVLAESFPHLPKLLFNRTRLLLSSEVALFVSMRARQRDRAGVPAFMPNDTAPVSVEDAHAPDLNC